MGTKIFGALETEIVLMENVYVIMVILDQIAQLMFAPIIVIIMDFAIKMDIANVKKVSMEIIVKIESAQMIAP